MEAEVKNFEEFFLGRTFGEISFGPLEPKFWVKGLTQTENSSSINLWIEMANKDQGGQNCSKADTTVKG